jgi:hypothetical protein
LFLVQLQSCREDLGTQYHVREFARAMRHVAATVLPAEARAAPASMSPAPAARSSHEGRAARVTGIQYFFQE